MNLEKSCHNFDPSTNAKNIEKYIDCVHCEYDKCNNEGPHHEDANAAATIMRVHGSLLSLLVASMLAFKTIN